ncbi:MAG: DUF2232 domain-containing protein [Nitrospinae bacterium]|nr:DUF2232 domain-containing protein [Nitrospinota bacterium]
MPDQRRIKEIVIPLVLLLAAFLTVLIFPPVGVVLGLIAPAPLILVNLQRGRMAGLMGIAALFVMILAAMGPKAAVIFAAEYGVLSAAMAESVRFQFSMEKSVFFSALASASLSFLALFLVFAGKETTLAELFQNQVKEHMEQSLETLKSMGKDKAELDVMKAAAEKVAGAFAVSYPAFIAVGNLMCAAVNFVLVQGLWRKMYGDTAFFPRRLSAAVLPDQAIWPLILSAGALFAGGDELYAAGLNVFVVMLAVYFLQGLAIVVHVLETKTVPILFWVLALFLIFTQPIVMGIVTGLGVFDMWVDFRKIRLPAPGEKPEE